MWLITLAVTFVAYVCLKLFGINSYWKEKGIPQLKPWPFFGNMAPVVFRKRALIDLIADFYVSNKDERYIGIYQFLKPTLLINDPELIKEITVKQFDAFPDHSIFSLGEESDDISTKNLFNLKVKNGWHDMRATLSPSFTSSKMRTMFALMEQCANQFIKHFEKKGDDITFEAKDSFTRFANDVIGTAAFGVTCDSLEEPNNEFYLMGKEVSDFNGIRSLKLFAYSMSPTIMKLFKVSLFSKKVIGFFQKLIKESLRIREEQQIIRPDMLHLLMEARKGRLIHEKTEVVDSGFAVVQESEIGKSSKIKAKLTDDDITAQALIFFLAGFDTAATLMSFTLYELALNLEVQSKLQEEIDQTLKSCNGNITYEALLGMKYLDNVISETLRKWPPGGVLDRLSIKPFTIEPEKPGDKRIILDAGTICWFSAFGIHRDAKYYPNPEKFDPERFSDKNKHNIKPFTYLPFGSGPRNCIGSRFALLESKLIIMTVLSKFTVVSTKKTQIPLKLSKKTFNLQPEHGFWLGLKPRHKSS